MLDMGKTAGMVEINRKYDPLALDLPGIPVGISACGEINGAVTANPDSRPGKNLLSGGFSYIYVPRT